MEASASSEFGLPERNLVHTAVCNHLAEPVRAQLLLREEVRESYTEMPPDAACGISMDTSREK